MSLIIGQFIFAVLTTIASIIAYLSWKKTGYTDETKKGFFFFFFYFIGFNLSPVFAFLIFGGNLKALAWSYIFSVIFLFLFLSAIWRMVLTKVFGLSQKKVNLAIKIMLSVCLFVTMVRIYDLPLPTFDASGFIVWNTNLIAAIPTYFASASLEVATIIYFIKNWPKNLDLTKKLKFLFFILGTAMFFFASLYFVAWSPAIVVLGLSCAILGVIFYSVAVFLGGQKVENIENKTF